MRSTMGVLAFALALAAPVRAAGAPRAELFGGYSYLHSDEGKSLNGWGAAASFRINDWAALTADASGHYGTELGGNVRFQTLMGGATLAYRHSQRVTPFVHALFGVVRETGSVKLFDLTLSESDNRFGMAFGGGVDVKLKNAWALRLAQVDYVTSTLDKAAAGDKTRDNRWRFAIGVVYRVEGR